MTRLAVEALRYLLYTEWLMRRRGLPALKDSLNRSQSRNHNHSRFATEQICRAVDVACVLYFKRVLCLQRSAATAMLLRRHGFSAELVIGVQIIPFRSHAWVELDRRVINDKPYMPELYREMERC